MKFRDLKSVLESTYELYHKPEFLYTDPIQCVHRFNKHTDIEIAGLLASTLAYGRAEIIIRNVLWVLEKISNQPEAFVLNTTFAEKKKLLKGFKHRFNDSEDVALLFEVLAVCIREFGSIENTFVSLMKNNGQSIKYGLSVFTEHIKKKASKLIKMNKKSFEYFFPSPDSGSACKRLNMFLRWMVRKEDSIDLGVWKSVSSSSLIIPVDTHIARIGQLLKFTDRKSADWKMAEEITAHLRLVDPDDPVRFDFSLCRAGMLTFRKDAA
jgi:uncharacterized protein (TIGR02757 family)